MIEIAVSPGAGHQVQTAEALAEGFWHHHLQARIVQSRCHLELRASTIVCWGWRKAAQIKHRSPEARLLIMERGYVGDRVGTWYSLGWDGLNGNARFPLIDDGGDRWRRYFPDALQPVRSGGDYILLLGQVRGDASLEAAGNFQSWYQRTFALIKARSTLPVYFRPHPLDVERYGKDRAYIGLPVLEGSLEDALAGAASAWGFNSNSLTDAALAGIPVHPFNRGAMTWPLRPEYLVPALDPAERERWAHRLAWCQWTLEEMRVGAAWEALQQAMPAEAPAWSEAWEEGAYAAA